MKHDFVSYEEVKQYYGRSYAKIIKALVVLKDKCKFRIDKSCGGYLELWCKGEDYYYLKVNHGLSNKHPFNLWYQPYYGSTMDTQSFATQAELVEYLEKKVL